MQHPWSAVPREDIAHVSGDRSRLYFYHYYRSYSQAYSIRDPAAMVRQLECKRSQEPKIGAGILIMQKLNSTRGLTAWLTRLYGLLCRVWSIFST